MAAGASSVDSSVPVRARGRSRWLPMVALAIATAAILGAGAAVSLQVTHSTESASGLSNHGDFLTHFQQIGSTSSTTPNPAPAVLSAAAATPTVLAGASASYLVDVGVAGHQAADFLFQETVGIALSTEVELRFQVTYVIGATTTTFAGTAYVETQAAAPGATLTFNIYWDSGQAAGVTLQSQLEVSQVCSAVGTCP